MNVGEPLVMHMPRSLVIALLLLVHCGRTSRDPVHDVSAGAGSGGHAGQPNPPPPPDARQAFAFGVAMPAGSSEPSPAYACTSQGAIQLGVSTKERGRLSPDGLRWAVARHDGVDVIEAPSLVARRLAGENVALEALRWSDDGERLGYFAGGVPMLADGDGSNGRALDVVLPDPGDELELPLVDWSASGERVGFVTRGVAVTAKRDGSAPRALSRRAARFTFPRGLAFSHDGRTAAVVDDASRALVLVDTASLDVTSTELFDTATIQTWVDGNEWLLASTPESAAVLVHRSGELRELGGIAAASPSAPEVAIGRFGVQLLDLESQVERELIGSELESGALFYRADGRAIQYLDTSSVRVVATADGALLSENPSWGLFGPDEWFAAARGGELLLTQLGDSSLEIRLPSAFPVKLPDGGGAWLKDGRFALADERGVHLISLDGTIVDVCPDVTRVDAFQLPRTNGY